MREQLTRAQKIARNRLDAQIEEIARRRCSGLAINVMDISKVFKAGYEAAHAGEPVEEAVVASYKALSQPGLGTLG